MPLLGGGVRELWTPYSRSKQKITRTPGREKGKKIQPKKFLPDTNNFSMPAYLSLIRHDIRGDLSKKWRNITRDSSS